MRRLAVSALFASVLAISACGDGPTGLSGSAEGRWFLQSINGTPPPVTIIDITSYRLEVLSGVLDLESNGTYTNTFTYRETENGFPDTVTETEFGTYYRSGSRIIMEDDQGFEAEATISGDQLTFVESGFTVRYAR
ncbi:MAG TPA: hypothetical protein VFZ56_11010 [Gemmatimonadaceae bacterium]